MSGKTVYLVTGANRGLGHALVSALLLRPDHVVIASSRHSTIPAELEALPRHSSSSILHVAAAQANGAPIVETADQLASLSSAHSEVDHIDVVIANAGTTGARQSILETTSENLLECLEVNAVAPLRLLQASWPLLQRAKTPKFIFIGSVVGSISGIDETGKWSNAVYGTSKAASNYLVRKAGKELEGQLAVCTIHPG